MRVRRNKPNKTAKAKVRTRRISFIRLVILFIVIGAGAAASIHFATRPTPEVVANTGSSAWTAPYVDVTLTPYFAFESVTDPVQDIVLSFVVAHHSEPCSPAWGAVFDLDAAGAVLDLDRRLVRLRQLNKDAVVSFGGAANDELAVTCTDVDSLVAAYASVVERYEVSTIDLDIEGDALGFVEANRRRAEAISRVQADRAKSGKPLAVWLTLPVAPSGMLADSLAVVDSMISGGVDLAGVNLMVMNFGESRDGSDMATAVETALSGAQQQLLGAYRRAGVDVTPAGAWARIGATPMIGRNDVAGDEFTLDNAQQLVDFVSETGIGRLSSWSLNRDRSCGPSDAGLGGPSNVCSHVDQLELGFVEVFSALSGRAAEAAGSTVPLASPPRVTDDADRSPYPIWRPDREYKASTKVVWHGYVYETKWWSGGDDPENPVENVWDTPWRIIGPVLEADLLDIVVIAEGIVDTWDGENTYEEGVQVWYAGLIYEAKWWNTKFQPNREVENEWDSPWREVDPRVFLADQADG